MSNFKGAYDDLADLTIAASVAPMSVIGDSHFVRLSDVPDEGVIPETIPEEENESNNDADTNNSAENNDSGENIDNDAEATTEHSPQSPQESEEELPETGDTANDSNEQQEEPTEEEDSPYFLMNEAPQNNASSPSAQGSETRPLILHPSYSGSAGGFQEPTHMKRLFNYCSAIYYLSVAMIVLFIGLSIYFYPSMPIYSVCNDEVAWRGIMKNIVAFRFDASFEVLGSLSNPNHIGAALDLGKGSFSFQGKQFGTFEVPPVTADPMSTTDFMIIVHISPEDKSQAIQLAEAYYTGKLILDAEFQGRIRIPALFDYTKDIDTNNIVIDINAASDRSLCHCPTWDDDKNHSTTSLEEYLGLEAIL